MLDDEDMHGLPSDEEVCTKNKNYADVEFQSALKKWKKLSRLVRIMPNSR